MLKRGSTDKKITSKSIILVWYLLIRVRENMVVLHPGSGKKVSFLPKKVRESQGISFLTTRMNPVISDHNLDMFVKQFRYSNFLLKAA